MPKALLASLSLSVLATTVVSTAHAQTSLDLNVRPPVAATAQETRQAYIDALAGMDMESIRAALPRVWSLGLNGSTYWTADLERAFESGAINEEPLRSQALGAFLQALKDNFTGTQNPESVADDIKIPKRSFMKAEELKALVSDASGQADIVLEMTAPDFAQFRSLREALLRLYPIMQEGGWMKLGPFDKDLKFGVRHPSIPMIKQRLLTMGYRMTINNDLFDDDLRRAVADIQLHMKMKPDGVISKSGRTWGYFAVSAKERVQQIQMDMEKLRWLPNRLEERHIFVNTAFSTFLMTDRGQNVTMNFRTVNGRKERKTPTMRDKITYLVLNPTWTVPPTVFLNDKVEAIRNMDQWQISDYFWKNQFDVYTPDFKRRLDPTTIDWWNITSSNVNFYIRQRPSYNNALGVVKFMMTNPYAIYLHDTNDRQLFSEPQRLLSSGCVRVERPMDLAEYLLRGTKWTRYELENFVSTPWTTMENETNVSLKNPMPVYLMPLTSTMSSDGIMRFTHDVYGHNALLSQRMRGLGN